MELSQLGLDERRYLSPEEDLDGDRQGLVVEGLILDTLLLLHDGVRLTVTGLNEVMYFRKCPRGRQVLISVAGFVLFN